MLLLNEINESLRKQDLELKKETIKRVVTTVILITIVKTFQTNLIITKELVITHIRPDNT